jgi:hypothetical protein
MTVLNFLKNHWRAVALAASTLLVFIAVRGYGHSQFVKGKISAEQTMALVAADQRARTASAEAAAKARNEAIYAEFSRSIDGINADRTSLARRLHDYEVRSRAVPAIPSEPGVIDAGEKPSGSSETDGLLDAYDTACRLDAAQLDALIRQVRAQLDNDNPQ